MLCNFDQITYLKVIEYFDLERFPLSSSLELDDDRHRTDVTVQLTKGLTISIQMGQCLQCLQYELVGEQSLFEVEGEQAVLG